MTLYTLAISLHVVTAILGLGQITGTAILASSASGQDPAAAAGSPALQRLVSGTTWSILVMLLTGVLIEYASGGAYHGTWWFRLSFAGLLALGAVNGSMRRALRKRESIGGERTLRGIARNARIMAAVTAAIAILMEVKPW